jgi:hypothetical protein
MMRMGPAETTGVEVRRKSMYSKKRIQYGLSAG